MVSLLSLTSKMIFLHIIYSMFTRKDYTFLIYVAMVIWDEPWAFKMLFLYYNYVYISSSITRSNMKVWQLITSKIKSILYWCQINHYTFVYVRKIKNIKKYNCHFLHQQIWCVYSIPYLIVWDTPNLKSRRLPMLKNT